MTTIPRTEATDPLCLSDTDAAALLPRAPWRRYAVVGDSLSAGTGDPSPGYRPLGWPDRVTGVLRRIRPDLAYLNTAQIGATTADTLATQVDRMRAHRPDLIHLPSGANDLFGPAPDFARLAWTLGDLFDRAADTGALLSVFTLGSAFVVPRYPDWPDRVRRVNATIRELAASHRVVLVDLWDHPVNARTDLLSADRIHFTTAGQAALATEVVRALAATLGEPV